METLCDNCFSEDLTSNLIFITYLRLLIIDLSSKTIWIILKFLYLHKYEYKNNLEFPLKQHKNHSNKNFLKLSWVANKH